MVKARVTKPKSVDCAIHLLTSLLLPSATLPVIKEEFTCDHCGKLLSVDVPYFALERAGRADPYYFCRDCAHFIGALMKKELVPR